MFWQLPAMCGRIFLPQHQASLMTVTIHFVCACVCNLCICMWTFNCMCVLEPETNICWFACCTFNCKFEFIKTKYKAKMSKPNLKIGFTQEAKLHKTSDKAYLTYLTFSSPFFCFFILYGEKKILRVSDSKILFVFLFLGSRDDCVFIYTTLLHRSRMKVSHTFEIALKKFHGGMQVFSS